MKRQIQYKFNYIEKCNMCVSPTGQQKILGKRLNRSQGKNPASKIGITTTICKCNRCNLIYSNPQPVPFDIHDHYGIPPEKYWQQVKFTVHEDYYQGKIERLKKLMAFETGMKSLDIGAGIGKAMIALENAGFDSYGLEPSKPFYEKAIHQMGISPNKLQNGMIENISYPENHFDFISFGAVLEHVYDPSYAINKSMKWLKPNGIVHIEVPSSDWLINKIINFYYQLTKGDYVGNISPMHIPFHLYEFGLKSFIEHSKLNNYEIAHHEFYVCQTYMPAVLDYILKPYMKWTDTGMQLCVWLRKK